MSTTYARSNLLREKMKELLAPLKSSHGVNEIYYREAKDDAMYPHIVFSFSQINESDLFRKDYAVDIDIWTKDEEAAQEIADAVEDIFNNLNDPDADILPTFFLEFRTEIEDTDKTIRRELIRVQAQLYEA